MKAALAKAREANTKGLGAIVNYLGEEIADPKIAASHYPEYLELQRSINKSGIDGCVSVKLTQLGLGAHDSTAEDRALVLAEAAESMNQMLWIDMEGSALTTRTLGIYGRVLEKHPQVGVALQAYLKRTEADINSLVEKGGKIRLVKGAYRENADIAFKSRKLVTQNYIRLLRLLFEKCEYFAVATHDSRPIDEAERLQKDYPRAKFEFEMLRGIRDNKKLELAKSGYRVVDYLPYGEEWYAYSFRRIKEHPSNVLLLLRSI